ncbi:MAG: 5-(carboxyamino)imidazole ribonucleotide mutase [Synergistaceae bacterium]|jgi:5-(carboxyamino)imidazole ribonucleotide mutase|nr:5-(carboxyamino)imidazole ribonucleotide mutase [Synergistaceae bacterium]
MGKEPIVGILTGSASDLGAASKAADVLAEFGVPFEAGIASAHRTPEDVVNYAAGAKCRGVKVIIAMAGLSAALPGVIASHTTLPVIGVPIASGPLSGADALLSVAQMPPGIPVASMGIDGARNAAILALRIIALSDGSLAQKLDEWGKKAADAVRASREKMTDMPNMPAIPPSAFEKGKKQ